MTTLSKIDLSAQKYISNPEIDVTLELALKLNRPILIEGPAGTGKTSVAISMAQALKWKLFRIQCYEGVTFESVIGEFDYKRQLLHTLVQYLNIKNGLSKAQI